MTSIDYVDGMGCGPDESERDAKASIRGQTVEMFGRLERGLDSVISQYYTPRHPLSTYFTLDVLSAEGFSYGLRREVFEAITRRHGLYDTKRIGHLHRVGRWRNFLAHVAGMETHDYSNDPKTPKVGYRDPKYPHGVLTVDEAFERFKDEWEPANNYVLEVIRKVRPANRFLVSGHIVEDPVLQNETYEAWLDASFPGSENS